MLFPRFLTGILAFCLLFSSVGTGLCDQYAPNTLAPDGFVLTAEFTPGKINHTVIADDIEAFMWNARSGEFEPCALTEETVIGNFLRLYKKDAEGIAHRAEIVLFEDQTKYWDTDATWIDGAGLAYAPKITDEVGSTIFSQSHRIPMGERLLTDFSFGDNGGVNLFVNHTPSPYWPNLDYHHLPSTDSRAMLTGYKSYLQSKSWSCGPACILAALEWFGVRNELNGMDMAMLRGSGDGSEPFRRPTDEDEMENILIALQQLGIAPELQLSHPPADATFEEEARWIQEQLRSGHPIIIGSNSYGLHYQTIIGYDTMGTDDIRDDVMILMDPFDTTDHNCDGYTIASYQRQLTPVKDSDVSILANPEIYAVVPMWDWSYTPVYDTEQDSRPSEETVYSDRCKLAVRAEDERSCDHPDTPYFVTMDFYNMDDTDTRQMLTGFKTLQETSLQNSGLASVAMVMNWFGLDSQIALDWMSSASLEEDRSAISMEEMIEIFTRLNEGKDQNWVWITAKDLMNAAGDSGTNPIYSSGVNIIAELLAQDVPILIGSDILSGHWQVVIGYDTLGTPSNSSDDILILADPYDYNDHNQDGYVLKSFDRLISGWYSTFDADHPEYCFIAAFPSSGNESILAALKPDA